MAKILYGVAGEGSGHSMRSKEIISYLLENGHQVKVVSYDKGYRNLKPFFDVEKIEGLGFSFKNNEVEYLDTFIKNSQKLGDILQSHNDINKLVKEYQPDVIFTDFEPITALAANLNKIPLISIDNQHFITGTKIKYPKKYEKDAFITAAFINIIVQNAYKYFAITFASEEVSNDKVLLFPPILRREILSAKTSAQDYVLVYLTSGYNEIVGYLKNIDKKFVVYGLDGFENEKNIIFKKPSQDEFLEDLRNCEAIIANAGFSLVGEALYLGKPYLAIPVGNQFEQVINAVYLEKLGYGIFCEAISAEIIQEFLEKIPEYQKNLEKYPKEDNSKIFREIDETLNKLCK
jgi:uncharacterized protein (TIGR00661 family)